MKYEDFHTYLQGGTIQSYTIKSSSGLTISNDAINNERIDYRITAVSASELQLVTIVITTTAGRIETRVINFNVRTAENIT